jgi:hypothetical protein
MKMTVLNLRKIGFAVVAASSMLVFSCGAEEAEATTDAAPAETPAPEVAPEPVAEPVAADTTAPACDGGDSCDGAH